MLDRVVRCKSELIFFVQPDSDLFFRVVLRRGAAVGVSRARLHLSQKRVWDDPEAHTLHEVTDNNQTAFDSLAASSENVEEYGQIRNARLLLCGHL